MTIRRVSPEEAATLMARGYTYVDVRSEGEWVEGHPSGSVNVPLLHAEAGGMRPNLEFLPAMLRRFPRDAALVLGCRAGVRSMQAAEILVAAGYTDVVEQRAGFEGRRDAFGQLVEAGWGRTGLPSTSGEDGGTPWHVAREPS